MSLDKRKHGQQINIFVAAILVETILQLEFKSKQGHGCYLTSMWSPLSLRRHRARVLGHLILADMIRTFINKVSVHQ